MRIPCEPTGVKFLVKSKPSARDRRRMERAVQIIRNRVERWLRIQYRKLLRAMRDDLLSFDHIPTDAELLALVNAYSHKQEAILGQAYSIIFPRVSALVIPDDTLKAWAVDLEHKELDDVDIAMREWMRVTMGENIKEIDSYTLEECRRLFRVADGHLQTFQELLTDSHMFSEMRARRIAVTETTIGVNTCISRTAKEVSFGRPLVKVWMTTGRLNVRSTHEVMDGKTVGIDDRFKVPRPDGGIDEMLYPGDSSKDPDPANVVNCHCIHFTQYAD